MPGRSVVLACGNPSRGDDAIGPLLLTRLGDWLAEEGLADGFVLIEDFQLQVEHALDLQGMSAALFIDAGAGTTAPFSLLPVVPQDIASHSTHALFPAAVLAVYRRITGEMPPPADVLCIRGESFELGAAPGVAALSHLEAAWPELQAWCRARGGLGRASGESRGNNVTEA